MLPLHAPGCKVGGSAPQSGALRREVFGSSAESRPISGYVLGTGSETVLLLGVVHGNEPAGEILLESFAEAIAERPDLVGGRRLVVVPVVNPDGLERRTRSNARGVDLNRNFPARNWTASAANGPSPASEPETRAVLKVIRQFRPSRILAVHSPLRMVNYDGPALDLAGAIAASCGYPVTSSVGYPTPGSLGSYTGLDWNTPTITLELGQDVHAGNVWPRFRRALEVFVSHPEDAERTSAPRLGS